MKTLAVSVALVGVWVAVGSQDAHTVMKNLLLLRGPGELRVDG